MTAQSLEKIKRFRVSLRTKYLLPILLFLLVSSLSVWALSFYFTERILTDFSNELILQSNFTIKEDLRNFMEVPKNIVNIDRGIYAGYEDTIDSHALLKTIFFNQLKNFESVMAIEYSDEEKEDVSVVRDAFGSEYSVGTSGPSTNYVYTLYSYTPEGNPKEITWELEEYDPTQLPWYIQGKENASGSWTPLYFWPNGDLGLDYVLPIIKNDAFHGVLLTSYTINSLSEHIKNLKPTQNSRILLAEETGLVIAGNDIGIPYIDVNGVSTRLLMKDLNDDIYNEIYRLMSEKYESFNEIPENLLLNINVGSSEYLVSLSKYKDDAGLSWVVIITIPEADYLAGVTRAARASTAAVVGLLAIAMIIYILLADRIVTPILRLSQASKEITLGNLNVSVPTITNDEIGDLTTNFNSMIFTIKNSLDAIKSRENAAIEERNKLDAILYNMGDGVFVIDDEKKIVLINKAALKLVGLTERQCLGMYYSDVLPFVLESDHSKPNTEFIDKAIETKHIQEMSNHTVLRRFDGTFLPVRDSASPILDFSGEVTGCVVVFRDVSDERTLEKTKDDFVALTSHQLRTPLTAIAWYTQLLTDKEIGKLNVEQLELAENIKSGADRMATLINALLRITNFELDRVSITKEDLSLSKTIDAVKTSLAPFIQEKKIKLEVNLDKDVDTYYADKDFMYLLLENLISNAIKFSKEGSKVEVKAEKVGNDLLFGIKDYGMGIDPSFQGKIFTKLFRTDEARSVDTMGAGLGLYLCKLIVAKLGGKIWFDSELDMGSTFFVRLPGYDKVIERS